MVKMELIQMLQHNLYMLILQRYLSGYDNLYELENQSLRTTIGNDECYLTFKTGRIEILNIDQNTSIVFDFPASPENDGPVVNYYFFKGVDFRETHIVNTEVYCIQSNVYLNSTNVVMDNTKKESCPNKLVFFAPEIVKGSFEDTLKAIKTIDPCTVKDYYQTGETEINVLQTNLLDAILKDANYAYLMEKPLER